MLTVRDLHKYFPVKRGPFFTRKSFQLKAVDGVSFDIQRGATFSLVGESGCGKTTTARMILLLEKPTKGQVLWEGQDVWQIDGAGVLRFRAAVQAVLQDPFSSMNPRMRVRDFISEPLLMDRTLGRRDRTERAREALVQVGLRKDDAHLFPHEFSGGQRQRIALARALVSSPQLIVLDEPVSSLDVSIRAQIMNLLKDLQERSGVSYLLIAHHLGTVRYLSHVVAVMYLGRIVELANSEDLFEAPLHPYTKALISAALPSHPEVQRRELVLSGDVPSPINIPKGCRLASRCPLAMALCGEVEPELAELAPGHWAACDLAQG